MGISFAKHYQNFVIATYYEPSTSPDSSLQSFPVPEESFFNAKPSLHSSSEVPLSSSHVKNNSHSSFLLQKITNYHKKTSASKCFSYKQTLHEDSKSNCRKIVYSSPESFYFIEPDSWDLIVLKTLKLSPSQYNAIQKKMVLSTSHDSFRNHSKSLSISKQQNVPEALSESHHCPSHHHRPVHFLDCSCLDHQQLLVQTAKELSQIPCSSFSKTSHKFSNSGSSALSFFPLSNVTPVNSSSSSLNSCFLEGSGSQLTPRKKSHRLSSNKNTKKLYFSQLSSWTHIHFCSKSLVSLSSSIGLLGKHLVSLQLCCNNLTSVPSEIGLLSNLTYLSLAQNNLKEIPESLGALRSLVELKLSNNSLRYLPKSIISLVNLQILLLDSNKLTWIPPEIGNLRNLITLDLSKNHNLKILPSELIKLKFLRRVKIEECPLIINFPLDPLAPRYQSLGASEHDNGTTATSSRTDAANTNFVAQSSLVFSPSSQENPFLFNIPFFGHEPASREEYLFMNSSRSRDFSSSSTYLLNSSPVDWSETFSSQNNFPLEILPGSTVDQEIHARRTLQTLFGGSSSGQCQSRGGASSDNPSSELFNLFSPNSHPSFPCPQALLCKENSESMSNSTSNKTLKQNSKILLSNDPYFFPLPSLKEFCAREILRSYLPVLVNLPSSLVTYFQSSHTCSFCFGPYIESWTPRTKYLVKNDTKIPLLYRLCWPHWRTEKERIKVLFTSKLPQSPNPYLGKDYLVEGLTTPNNSSKKKIEDFGSRASNSSKALTSSESEAFLKIKIEELDKFLRKYTSNNKNILVKINSKGDRYQYCYETSSKKKYAKKPYYNNYYESEHDPESEDSGLTLIGYNPDDGEFEPTESYYYNEDESNTGKGLEYEITEHHQTIDSSGIVQSCQRTLQYYSDSDAYYSSSIESRQESHSTDVNKLLVNPFKNFNLFKKKNKIRAKEEQQGQGGTDQTTSSDGKSFGAKKSKDIIINKIVKFIIPCVEIHPFSVMFLLNPYTRIELYHIQKNFKISYKPFGSLNSGLDHRLLADPFFLNRERLERGGELSKSLNSLASVLKSGSEANKIVKLRPFSTSVTFGSRYDDRAPNEIEPRRKKSCRLELTKSKSINFFTEDSDEQQEEGQTITHLEKSPCKGFIKKKALSQGSDIEAKSCDVKCHCEFMPLMALSNPPKFFC